jgi:hypothetical protein
VNMGVQWPQKFHRSSTRLCFVYYFGTNHGGKCVCGSVSADRRRGRKQTGQR